MTLPNPSENQGVSFWATINFKGQVIPLSSLITVGRHEDNDVVLDDPSISSYHAVFERQGYWFILRDLNSSNGTAVNSTFIKKSRLKSGDVIKLGACYLTFECSKVTLKVTLQHAKSYANVFITAFAIVIRQVLSKISLNFLSSTSLKIYLSIVLVFICLLIGLNVFKQGPRELISSNSEIPFTSNIPAKPKKPKFRPFESGSVMVTNPHLHAGDFVTFFTFKDHNDIVTTFLLAVIIANDNNIINVLALSNIGDHVGLKSIHSKDFIKCSILNPSDELKEVTEYFLAAFSPSNTAYVDSNDIRGFHDESVFLKSRSAKKLNNQLLSNNEAVDHFVYSTKKLFLAHRRRPVTIVSKIGENLYEAVEQYDGNQHFILKTKTLDFSSAGRTALAYEYIGKTEITQHNGFPKTVRVCQERPETGIIEYESLIEEQRLDETMLLAVLRHRKTSPEHAFMTINAIAKLFGSDTPQQGYYKVGFSETPADHPVGLAYCKKVILYSLMAMVRSS